jgi:pimeloyl-ACP methyl ester carboxylesterase
MADAPREPPGLLLGATRDRWADRPPPGGGHPPRRGADPLKDRLAAVEAPALIMRGARDPLTRRWAHELAARAGGPAAVAEVPRTAHALGYAAPTPRAVPAALGAFLG